MNEISHGIAAAALCAATTDAAGTIEGRYLFEEGFAGFGGHFPDFPILPAIVEIMTVVALAGDALGCRQRLVAVQDAKFLNPVRPGQELLVRCKTRTVQGKLCHDAQLKVGDTTAATLLLELARFEESP
ncbi:MAG TPA: 3-hydroxyacyl-ACP dehydratase [Geobacter sp.]|nr:3-hydroxyacyl-ACP dehydratase [Geobacter sp.]